MFKRPRRNVSAPKQTVKRPSFKRQKQTEHRDRYDWMTLWTAIIGVAIVCVGTGISAYQAIVTRQELDNTIRELNYTMNQQRAWVKVQLVPGEALSVRDGVGTMRMKLLATNVGAVPAIDVSGGAKFGVVPGPRGLGREVPSSTYRPCQAERTGGGFGVTIFPGETVEIAVYWPEIQRKQIEAAADDRHQFSLLASGCITYRSGDRLQEHQTASMYIVGPKPDGSSRPAFFETPRDEVPPDRLRIERFGLSEKAD